MADANHLPCPIYTGPQPPKRFSFSELVLLVFGLLLPIAAVVVENTWHICAQTFFDPLPTRWHVLFACTLPLASLLVLLARRVNMEQHFVLLSLLNGMAAGTAMFYALLFLPITPLAVVAILFVGIGMLPLSPALGLWATILAGKLIEDLKPSTVFTDLKLLRHVGHVAALAVLIGIELPSACTRMAVEAATHQKTVAPAIAFLRTTGDRDVMLRMCYERSRAGTDLIGACAELIHAVPVESAQKIYYRVTGKAFNSVAIPKSARATIAAMRGVDGEAGLNTMNAANVVVPVDDDFDLDTDIAGENVGSVSRGLSLEHSQIAGSIDPDTAIADLNWTMVFHNRSTFDREARAQVLLPPKAVVNRVSLWIKGVEHKAVFGKKGQVRAAYQAVVRKRRDPLLVTSCGPDRILIQCFPVMPNSSMKIKIGLAAPLVLQDRQHGLLPMPAFIERNFQIKNPYKLAVASRDTIAADWAFPAPKARPQSAWAAQAATIMTNQQMISGEATAAQISNFGATVKAFFSDRLGTVACAAPAVVQTVAAEKVASPRRLAIVIDGSADMGRRLAEISQVLTPVNPDCRVQLIFVSDSNQTLTGQGVLASSQDYQEALRKLSFKCCVGGQDDSSALMDASSFVADEPDSAILWIHGPQPVLMDSSAWFKEKLKNSLRHTPVYDLQVVAGTNRVVEWLEKEPNYHPVVRTGTLGQDLDRLMNQWAQRLPAFVYEWKHGVSGPEDTSLLSSNAADCLADLCAANEVYRLIKQGSPKSIKTAESIACRQEIVTPVTGAVVLENEEQYLRAGLKSRPGAASGKPNRELTKDSSDKGKAPAPKNELIDWNQEAEAAVPTVPEAETWLLIMAMALILGWQLACKRWRRRPS